MSRLWINGKEVAVPAGRAGQTLLTFLRGELHVELRLPARLGNKLPRPAPAGQPPLCAPGGPSRRARVRSR